MFSSPLLPHTIARRQPANASSAEAPHPASACTKSQSDPLYKLADSQFPGTHPQKYMMIWEIETDNLAGTFDRVKKGLETGTTVTKDSYLDDATGNSQTMTPITNRLTAEEVKDKSPDEVRELALKGVTIDPH
jgi:hypothetical protein